MYAYYIYMCVCLFPEVSPVQCRYDISLSLTSLACILLKKEQYLTTIIKMRMLIHYYIIYSHSYFTTYPCIYQLF